MRWRVAIRAMQVGATAVVFALFLVASFPDAAGVSYPAVVPGYRIEFPRDEGSHPEFRTEWWYVTGWLEDESGAPRGFQVTFFRTRPGIDEDNPSRFAAKQVLFAHAALSDPPTAKLLRSERAARAGFGLATATQGSLDVSIDDWSLRTSSRQNSEKRAPSPGTLYRASVNAEGFALELDLQATQPPLLQGNQGFSRKGPDPLAASYYYSLPQLQTTGRIVIGKREYKVHGVAWLDHEWSTLYMDEQAQGWDWLGANLDDGGALMVFRMRAPDGRQRWAAATWASGNTPGQNRSVRTFSPADVQWSGLRRWRSSRTGIEYPVEWRIRVGERTIRLQPLMDDQENDTRGSTGTIYWEGAVRAFDEHDRPLGRGYLELTGYGKRVSL